MGSSCYTTCHRLMLCLSNTTAYQTVTGAWLLVVRWRHAVLCMSRPLEHFADNNTSLPGTPAS